MKRPTPGRTGTLPHPACRLLHTAAGEALEQLQGLQPISDEVIHDVRKASG